MTAVLMFSSSDSVVRRLTFAVRLEDDFAPGRDVIGPVAVTIDPGEMPAVRNPGGWYLFVDLPAGRYRVAATAAWYLPAGEDVDTTALDPREPVVTLPLKPTGAYPFPPRATLVRGMVKDHVGNGVGGARLEAVPWLPASAPAGRVRQGGAQSGQATLRLENAPGGLAVGDQFLIRDSEPEQAEFVTLIAPLPAHATQPYLLAAPLRFTHAAGTPLHLLEAAAPVSTVTNAAGDFVVYFTGSTARNFVARLTASSPGCQPGEVALEMSEGRCVSAGIIGLPPL